MINIAIDGPTASGKTTVGKLIAENFNYQFIDTENILNEINTIIKNLSEEDYFYSEQQAAKLSKNVELCEKINSFLCEITKEKGFVVVGRDVTFNILPDAEIKIFLSADIDIRALRRARQLKLNNITNDIWLDILNQDSKSFALIEEAKKVSKIIDTTNLTLANIVDMVLTQLTN
ncbi:P-loop containing nucleoside triphosphate hydrolase protein [Gigaspora rosea]|uniref:(d)CMP kinase n=1 Tax=Gigaspora rosea TaxID=44941 RepID=A0A397TXS1_9GLOM|nr:P-loop containing nucleoside triphosphate hydrolase protein [Gigaspora rosea]